MNATITSRSSWQFARKLITSTLTVAVLAALGATQVQAGDSKIYPGSMCDSLVGSTKRDHGRLFNPGATVTTVECPVVHDSSTTGIQSGYVDVLNSQPTGSNDPVNNRVCAYLISVSQLNFPFMTVRSSGRKCSLGPAAGRTERMAFSSLPVDANAHYFYSVSIPPIHASEMSGVISYQVVEK